MSKRSSTTKDIGLLRQLHTDSQLLLAAEFQRNSVWPQAAKAYLIDTILNDRPIPVLYFQRTVSAQTGRSVFTVIDGQQRLRAIFEFMDDRVRLTQSTNASFKNLKFSGLSTEQKSQVLNYDLLIEELTGYDDEDIKDMFIRMNKYVVRLSKQELRHAREKGKFKDFVEGLGGLEFWSREGVFSQLQIRRMRPVELAAELAILLIEGPQDKKEAIDLYYVRYKERFPGSRAIRKRLKTYLRWIKKALPDLSESRFRKPVDLYSLVGALDLVSNGGRSLSKLKPGNVTQTLTEFERKTKQTEPKGVAARYLLAASRQTDNIGPRKTRIEIIASILTP
jgi:hypothetical protein